MNNHKPNAFKPFKPLLRDPQFPRLRNRGYQSQEHSRKQEGTCLQGLSGFVSSWTHIVYATCKLMNFFLSVGWCLASSSWPAPDQALASSDRPSEEAACACACACAGAGAGAGAHKGVKSTRLRTVPQLAGRAPWPWTCAVSQHYGIARVCPEISLWEFWNCWAFIAWLL